MYELTSNTSSGSLNSCSSHEAQNNLINLCDDLRTLPGLISKKSIRHAAAHSDKSSKNKNLDQLYSEPGDDCAAFACENGYQLFAIEGMDQNFVKSSPRAAGWSSVMVNISDIAAMGGRPTAITNALWHSNEKEAQELFKHIKRACDAFDVKFSGGHTTISPTTNENLALAITGFAKQLLSCHHLEPGQELFLLTDLDGSWHGDSAYWACTLGKTSEQLRKQWEIPAELAEKHLAVAAKDISNGGIFGTLLMMLELTGCGADIHINDIPRPQKSDLIRWLSAFQSFGFLLSVPKEKTEPLEAFFNDSPLICQKIGTVTNNQKIIVRTPHAEEEFWDLSKEALTNMGT